MSMEESWRESERETGTSVWQRRTGCWVVMESDGDVVQIVRCVWRNVMSGGWGEVDRSWIAISEGGSAL